MPESTHYDTISIGSGESGKYVCWDRASHGHHTAGKRTLTADHIILCTGSRTKVDHVPGLKEVKPLTHIELMNGIEFAQAWRRFGAEVTVLERGKRILKNEDGDVVEALAELLKTEGVRFHVDTHVTNVSGTSGQSVTLRDTEAGEPFSIEASHILIAGGRTPNTEECGLEEAGVQLTPKGHIQVDEYLQTNVTNIFAVGDCANSPHFTHMGFDDFRIVRDFLAKANPLRSTANRQVPYTLYTSPELAHVGFSESAAQLAGIKYRLAKAPMAAFLRTRTMDATQGFAKALVSAEDDTILGFTALGPSAGELLPVVQLAMSEKLPYTKLSGLIVTHPTMSEGLVSLFGGVPPPRT